ncbi:putative conserved hypothetical protein [Colletotrichum sublineola]|uniref:Integrase catalytic domain-containing protein n=1 Tax=Colletotrichum sublineola TaxID=1173701 RepID=A0A066X5S4_COLSU|nr:putative conserved hypothetical protein [Colletotrichum sublineola]
MKRIEQPSAYFADQPSDESDQYWVDRTYRGQGRNNRFKKRDRNRGPPCDNNSNSSSGNYGRGSKKCFVCHKTGCWSTKHTLDERRNAYQRFKSNHHMKDPSPSAYATFLVDFEGNKPLDATDDDNDLRQYFEASVPFEDAEDEQPGDTFHTSATFFNNAPISGKSLTSQLADQAVFHHITKADPRRQGSDQAATAFLLDQYSAKILQGILPDTGASRFSTAGHQQAVALGQVQPQATIDKEAAGQAKVRFGNGKSIYSSGTITATTPFGPIVFHVVPTNTPFLLCLADTDRLVIRFDNLTNTLHQGNLVVPIVRKWGHPWMLFGPPEPSIAHHHLTDVELRRLHRRLGHPFVQRLHKVLCEAGHNDVEMKALEQLTKHCHQCQLHGGAPSRFRFTLRDNYNFNYEVIVDVMHLDGDPVLDVVDSATAFNAALFLRNISAKTTWGALRLCWIDVYQGPPKWVTADAGRNFVATEFTQEGNAMGVQVKIVPVEAHHSIGKVERYHAVLRRAYSIIRKECPNLPREAALQTAIKTINDTAGPGGIWRAPRRCHRSRGLATTPKAPALAATNVPTSPRRLRGRLRKTPVNGPQQGVSSHAPAFLSTKEQADLILVQQLRTTGIIATPGEPFEESTKREINALIDRGVFEIITYDRFVHKERVFKSRIVNEVKDKTTNKPYKKSPPPRPILNRHHNSTDPSTLAFRFAELNKAGLLAKAKVTLTLDPKLIFKGGIISLASATDTLNQRLQWQMNPLDRGLHFIPLDLASAKLFVFVDGSFANNHDFTSQLGVVIVLANEFSSTKSKRVTRSVLASELYGMVAGADMAYAISTTIAVITNKLDFPTIPTVACTDSYSLYECLVTLGTTQEKWLMIDIMALRQSYERRELFEVQWVNGEDNPADAFTKSAPNKALEKIISTNNATIRMEG